MVDFNNETTVTRPATEIVKFILLQGKSNLLEAYEAHVQRIDTGVGGESTYPIVKARLITLFMDMYPICQRQFKKEAFKEFQEKIMKLDNQKQGADEHLFDCMIELITILDKIKVTRIDSKRDIDRTRVENENTERDF